MIKKRNRIDIMTYSIYILFFLFGFDYLRAYMLFIPVVLFIAMLTKKRIIITFHLMIIFCLYFFTLLTLFLFNDNDLIVPSGTEWKVILNFMIVFFFGGLFISHDNLDFNIKLIKFFLLGLFFKTIIVVLYSFNLDPIKYGYALLMDPFSGKETNSPGYSNALLISFSLFWFTLFYEKRSTFINFISLAAIVVSFLLAVFLGGRTFFLLAPLVVAYFFVAFASQKSILKYLLLTAIFVLLFCAIYFLYANEILNSVIIQRFSSLGMGSPRFSLYLQGIRAIPYYPFGGVKIDQNIDTVPYFHNIILDTMRIGGWIPMVLLLTIFAYSMKSFLYKSYHEGRRLISLLLILVFLIMQQDVIWDGERQNFSLFLFSSLILLNSSKRFLSKEQHPKGKICSH